MSGFFGFLSFVAFVCFIIGLIKPDKMVFWTKKKTRGMACLYLVACIIFGIIAGVSSGNSSGNSSNSSASTSVTSSQAESSTTTSQTASSTTAAASSKTSSSPSSVDVTLSNGFYTVGVDIPAGTYDFTAKSGSGNVMTDDASVNEIMGTEKGSEKSYKNAELSDGTVLEITTVSLRVKSSEVTGTIKARNQSITKSYTFSSGNYKAGKDFKAGTYDVTAVSGNGNVTDDDINYMLNSIMGTQKGYVKVYKNVPFESGTKLTISGVKVKITPSK